MNSSITINMDDISLAIGLVSLVVSIVFYFFGLKSSYQATQTLIKIDEQVGTLKTINSKLLTKILDHFTSTNDKLISSAITGSKPLLDENKENSSQLNRDIVLYIYAVRTMFLASKVRQSGLFHSIFKEQDNEFRIEKVAITDADSAREIVESHKLENLKKDSAYSEYLDASSFHDTMKGIN
jgi:hypothetical protein